MEDRKPHIAGVSSPPAGPWLEIVRGKTSFPCRPIRTDRFLIGAGSQCDLQLGGASMPMLHCLILATEAEVSIEAFVPVPPLRVDGIRTRSAELQGGELISIGGVDLRFHARHAMASQTRAATLRERFDAPHLSPPESTDETAVPSEMTMPQLLDALEAEIQRVTSVEERQELGAMALLEAVRRAGDEETSTATSSDVASLGEADTAHEFVTLPIDTEALAEREDQIREFGEVLSARATELAEIQERLAIQIDQVREKVRLMERPDDSEPLRISA